jgi:hypothetical protein
LGSTTALSAFLTDKNVWNSLSELTEYDMTHELILSTRLLYIQVLFLFHIISYWQIRPPAIFKYGKVQFMLEYVNVITLQKAIILGETSNEKMKAWNTYVRHILIFSWRIW